MNMLHVGTGFVLLTPVLVMLLAVLRAFVAWGM
jgi:hypothetical protein